MCERVVGPGLLAAQVNGMARSGLGFAQVVALLPAKGQHAVQVGHVGRSALHGARQAQHAGRVATVEQVVLAELDGHEVAWELGRLLLVQADRGVDVAGCPGGHGGDEAALAQRGFGGLRAGQVGAGVGRGRGRLGEHVQRGAVGLHAGAVVLVSSLQDAHGPGFARDEAAHEVVDPVQARGVLQRDGVAQTVDCHGAQLAGGCGQGRCGSRSSS
jgi:hypothetical protein